MSVAWSSPGRPSRERSERTWRRATVVLSIGAHVAAALGAIAYSFWHVEELQPPRVTVTFVSAASLPPPPPPPPPPLAGGGGAPKRPRVVRPKVDTVPEVKTPPVVEPPVKPTPVETPHETPPDSHPTKSPIEGPGTGPGSADGVKNGVVGGVKNGVVGGVVGGQVGAPVPPPKFLPPQMGAQRKLSGADPDFPAVLRHPGATYLIMAKICVGIAGNVDSVTLQKRAEPTLDANVVAAVKGWRFQPMTANGTPVPFCYFGRFEFKSD
ncbi:MAG TPA: energy transducer TonB [Polyangia bacterium]|nr:energy transducer TonB [Polyangia bacterium]